MQELAHLFRERRNRFHAVEDLSTLSQTRPRLIDGCLQLSLPLTMLPDARRNVGQAKLGGLHSLVEFVEPPAYLAQLGVRCVQLLPQRVGFAIHLLVEHNCQVPHVLLG